jgi:hypothetical protein
MKNTKNKLTMFAWVVALAVPGVSLAQGRASDCYGIPEPQKTACRQRLGITTIEQQNPHLAGRFTRGPRYFGDWGSVAQAMQGNWRFTRVLHGLYLDAPTAVGSFSFTAQGRYTFTVSLHGETILEQQGVYRVADGRPRQFPQLSLTATASRVGNERLANVIRAAGLVNPDATDFYIAIADDRSATLFTDACPTGCPSYYTQLSR